MSIDRTSIREFATEKPWYGGHLVYAYTIDATGAKTATKATLYSAPSGTGALSNPQKLTSRGRFSAPVYIDEPVFLVVENVGTGQSVDTGVVGLGIVGASAQDAQAAANSALAYAKLSQDAARRAKQYGPIISAFMATMLDDASAKDARDTLQLTELLGGTLTSGGTANAHTLTPTVPLAAYYDGLRILYRAHDNNTGALTLNVSGLGAKSVFQAGSVGARATAGGEAAANCFIEVAYWSAANGFVIVGQHVSIAAEVNRNNVDQTAVADGVWTKLQLNNEVFDYGAANRYDAVTNFRWTPVNVGKTLIVAQVHFKNVTVGGLIGISIEKNGTSIGRQVRDVVSESADGRGIIGITRLADHSSASDYFEIFVLQDSDAGAAKDISGVVADTFATFTLIREVH